MSSIPSQMQNAYTGKFNGCFVDVEGIPSDLRRIARYERDKLRRNCRNGFKAEEVLTSPVVGSGTGQRAVNFQYFMKLDPYALMGSQDYGNCTSWMTREMVGQIYGIDIAVKNEPHIYIARPGTAVVYGSRGTSSQGMALATAMNVIHNKGIQLMIEYLGEYDFTDEDTDEAYGNNWGRRGVPSNLLEAISDATMEQVSAIQDEQACLDVLFNGGAIGHGSTLTGTTRGELISSLTSIGGHAQAWLGYDDTEEFRDWYKQSTGKTLKDWVAINDQSWGNWNNFPESLWPDHLWGPRPQGAWVVTGKDQMKIINQWGDAYAISNLIGFPSRELPPWQDAFDWL